MSVSFEKSTWSQLGEDSILSHFFKDKNSGFYVDVGAFHPERYSNTCLLHKRGWRGVNIDVSPKTTQLFRAKRPNDFSINAAVGNEDGSAVAFMFGEGISTVNTLDRAYADSWKERTSSDYTEKKIRVAKLRTLLSELGEIPNIDFLNIDVEGLEMQVLAGAEIEELRPRIMAVEIHAPDVQSVVESEVVSYLCGIGYRFVAYSLITAFFVLK